MARSNKGNKGKDKKEKTTVGGFAFYLSLSCLTFVALFNVWLLPPLITEQTVSNWSYFGIGLFVGTWVALLGIRGKLSVFLHEFRHSVVSGLVGNRSRGMVYRGSSGHFKYEYTPKTAHYNALISLAPYFLPVFTFVGAFLAFILFRHSHQLMILVVSVGYGVDLVLNLRDISPIQTDLTTISGGYKVGLAFVVLMNVAIFTFVAAWVSQDLLGLKSIVYGHYRFMLNIVAWYRGKPDLLT